MNVTILDEEYIASLPHSNDYEELEMVNNKHFGKYLHCHLTLKDIEKASKSSEQQVSKKVLYRLLLPTGRLYTLRIEFYSYS